MASLAPAVSGVELASDIGAHVQVTTSLDRAAGLYTYRYTIANDRSSGKLLHEFHIPLRGATALNVQAPRGWEGSTTLDRMFIGWCACAAEGVTAPADQVDDGRDLPSRFAVAPGATLSGFSFQSTCPPAPGSFHAGAWVPVPIEGVDFGEGQEPAVPAFPDNLLRGAVAGSDCQLRRP